MSNIKIGFRGGSSVFILGTDSDMQLFFDCIQFYLVPKYPDQDWSVLTDRLYRRYLKLEELDIAESLMKLVEQEFKQLGNDAIGIKSSEIKSNLDITKGSLFDIFNRYFYGFCDCVESAKMHYETFESYRPVMAAITSLPYSMSYKDIPLSVFDGLSADAKPIW